MSFLVANLPPIDVLVRRQYLRDLTDGFGEYESGSLVSVKSVKGKALYFEVLLEKYGAVYDKLPISALCWKPIVDELPLDYLQIWDCFDYYITIIEKSTLRKLRCKFFDKDKNFHSGQYMFTIDTCHVDTDTLNVGFSEYDSEHKSFNIIKLDNGQFAAQPNNRMRWYEQSLVVQEPQFPDFIACSQNYSVEQNEKWSDNRSKK